MKTIKKILENFEVFVLLVTLPIMTIITLAGTTVRYLELGSLTWSEEAARYLMVIAAYAGISMGFKDDTHLGMSFIVDKFSGNVYKILRILRDIIIIFFALTFSYLTFSVVSRLRITYQASPAMGIPMWMVYTPMLIGFILILIRSIQMLLRDIRLDPPKDTDTDTEVIV